MLKKFKNNAQQICLKNKLSIWRDMDLRRDTPLGYPENARGFHEEIAKLPFFI